MFLQTILDGFFLVFMVYVTKQMHDIETWTTLHSHDHNTYRFQK